MQFGKLLIRDIEPGFEINLFSRLGASAYDVLYQRNGLRAGGLPLNKWILQSA